MKSRALLAWSSGKDSAWALHVLRRQGEHEIAGLFTTVNAKYDRVAMHAVRRRVVERQAEAAGLPLLIAPLPDPCSNEQYEAAMREALAGFARNGITHLAFGDLFLADIRAYRERNMAGTGITPLFPLWGLPTRPLLDEMLDAGLEAVITCVDPRQVPARWAGQRLGRELLGELPPGADPCGENGEYHTCVVNGPMFRRRLPVTTGEVVERGGFVFADVLAPSDAPGEIRPPLVEGHFTAKQKRVV